VVDLKIKEKRKGRKETVETSERLSTVYPEESALSWLFERPVPEETDEQAIPVLPAGDGTTTRFVPSMLVLTEQSPITMSKSRPLEKGRGVYVISLPPTKRRDDRMSRRGDSGCLAEDTSADDVNSPALL